MKKRKKAPSKTFSGKSCEFYRMKYSANADLKLYQFYMHT